jgi:Holliday junction resolvasome RuvABC ATP-dependent DNA helicase subunit
MESQPQAVSPKAKFRFLSFQNFQKTIQIPAKMRKSPNIIVTGTPGVGKTSHAELLAEKTGLKHLAINKVAEEQNCYDGRDEELQTWIVDEDKVR